MAWRGEDSGPEPFGAQGCAGGGSPRPWLWEPRRRSTWRGRREREVRDAASETQSLAPTVSHGKGGPWPTGSGCWVTFTPKAGAKQAVARLPRGGQAPQPVHPSPPHGKASTRRGLCDACTTGCTGPRPVSAEKPRGPTFLSHFVFAQTALALWASPVTHAAELPRHHGRASAW